MRHLAYTAIITALALLPAPASAMDKGMQQETMTPAFCDQIAATGSKWARLMVQPELYAARRDSYIATVKRCKADGLKVMVSIMHWYQTSPRLSAGQLAFASAIAARDLGPWADAWAPINEPNHPAFAVDWKPYLTATVRTAHPTAHRTVTYKRVAHGRYRRVWRDGAWRYRTTRRRRGHWRRTVKAWTTSAYTVDTVSVRTDVALARASRAAYDAAAAAIRRQDPTSLLVFGDTAWADGTFMKLMLAAKAGLPDADIVGIHYALPTQDVRDVAERLDAPMWVTEWGRVPSQQGDLAATLKTYRAAGVQVFIYYNGLAWNGTWRDQRLTLRNRKAFIEW